MVKGLSLAVLMAVVLVVGAACDRRGSAAESVRLAEVVSEGETKATKSGPSAKVAKIVFVDKQQACDCTRKRIDTSWEALNKVLGSPPSVPVERLFLDTQAEQVEPYLLMERLMVPPGIYFVDEGNGVIRLLQGEVTEPDIRQVLSSQG